DGALWFTDEDGVGRISASGVVSSIYHGLNYPAGITTGPDGNLWFTGFYQGVVGRLTPHGKATLFHVNDQCSPEGIAASAKALWLTCYYTNDLYRVSTSGTVRAFPIPSLAYGIVRGDDGAMWFTEGSTDRIGRISTS